MKVRDRQRRISEEFARDLDDIKVKRMKLGVDKKMISDARITEGLLKDPEFPRIKDRLIRMPRKEDLR